MVNYIVTVCDHPTDVISVVGGWTYFVVDSTATLPTHLLTKDPRSSRLDDSWLYPSRKFCPRTHPITHIACLCGGALVILSLKRHWDSEYHAAFPRKYGPPKGGPSYLLGAASASGLLWHHCLALVQLLVACLSMAEKQHVAIQTLHSG